MPGHCAIGAGGPPHRQSTSTQGCSAAAALHYRSSPTRRCGPASPPPSAPRCCPQGRGCGGGLWESGGRRAAARPEQRSRSGCTSPRRAPSPVGSCPLHRFASDPVSTDGCEDKVGGNATCTRDCTRRFVLMLLLFFFDLRLVCVALPFIAGLRRHPRRMRLLLRPSRLQRRRPTI